MEQTEKIFTIKIPVSDPVEVLAGRLSQLLGKSVGCRVSERSAVTCAVSQNLEGILEKEINRQLFLLKCAEDMKKGLPTDQSERPEQH